VAKIVKKNAVLRAADKYLLLVEAHLRPRG
jgi:hypothetical protein